MNEANKTYSILSEIKRGYLTGKGIDIGCGRIPVVPNAQPFDVAHGDANRILDYVNDIGGYDFVFSSHCLEHMIDPHKSLFDWWQLVKPGGWLIFAVPDEDLYEQGWWPSIFNVDHKHTFTISKTSSWSPVSINVLDLIKSMPNVHDFSIELMDLNYDRKLKKYKSIGAHRAIKLMILRDKLTIKFPFLRKFIKFLSVYFQIPFDQTQGEAVAQIFVVARKV